MSYLNNELLQVKPTTKMPGHIKLQLTSEHGKTKWLNVTEETLKAIELALEKQYND